MRLDKKMVEAAFVKLGEYTAASVFLHNGRMYGVDVNGFVYSRGRNEPWSILDGRAENALMLEITDSQRRRLVEMTANIAWHDIKA